MSRARSLAVMQRIEILRWALSARQQAAILAECRHNAGQRQQLTDTVAGLSEMATRDRLALLTLLVPAAIAEERRLDAAAQDLEGRRSIAEQKLQRIRRRREHLGALADAEHGRAQRRRDQREDEQSAELWHAYCRREHR